MADILIKNGLILTMNRSRRVMKGSISIEDGKIKEVGNPEDERADKVIDAEGKIVMPGLICAYSHPCKILLRAAPLKTEPPTDFTQILQRVWWPLDEEVSNEDTYISTLATSLEFIKTGVTFFAGLQSSQGSIGKSLDYVASAAEKAGLRAIIGFRASERNTRAEGARGMKENVRFLENRRKKDLGGSRVRGMVGLDFSFATSNELLKHGERVADRFDVPISISAAEGEVDLYHNLENHGKRTIERFRDVGLLSSNTVLAHCVHINDDELSMIEKANAGVAHVPLSNMRNATGIAKVLKMREMDIPVGLGNDSHMFNEFENIRALYSIHKAMAKDPRVVSSMEALEMATIQGAELYGMENRIGSIEAGKKADIIIINPSNRSTPLNHENVADYIVNAVSSSDVETMMVGGDLLMENRSIKTLDEKRTMKKSRETAKKTWKELK